MLTTFGGWCLVALLYLFFASSTVAWVVFWKSSDVDFGGHIGIRRNRRQFTSEGSVPPRAGHVSMSLTDMEMQKKGRLHTLEFEEREKSDEVKYMRESDPSDLQEVEDNDRAGGPDFNPHSFPPNPRRSAGPVHPQRIGTNTSNAPATKEKPKISRRTLALRAMTLRLIGYILIPVFCVLPSVIRDLIIKAYPVGQFVFPDVVAGMIDGLNGLVGLFNAILFLVDPVLLILWAELRANHRWGRMQKERTAQHENRSAVEVGAETDGNSELVGIRSTHLGRSDTPRGLGQRAFEGSLVSDLRRLDKEQRPSRRFSVPRPFRSHRKRHEAQLSGGAGLAIHVEVQVMKHSDLERVEDYLHGL